MTSLDPLVPEPSLLDQSLLDPSRQPAVGAAPVPVPERLVFESGGEFIRETQRDVQAYLSDGRTRRAGYLKLYTKAPIAIGLLVSSWVVLVVLGHGLQVVLPCLVGITLGAILTAFCVQHDANHGAYFRKRRYNHALGWTSDALLGISSYSWRVKHNVAHHTYTNVDGFDDDVTQVPLARFAPSQRRRPWYRAAGCHRVAASRIRWPKGWNLAGLVSGKLIFVSWAIVVPLLIFPWWQVLITYPPFSMVLSLVMATTFQLAQVFAARKGGGEGGWGVVRRGKDGDFFPATLFFPWCLGGPNSQFGIPSSRKSPPNPLPE